MCLQTGIWWTCLLLFCLYCHREIRPAACKPQWMRAQFPCDVTANVSNHTRIKFDCKGRHLHKVPHGITSNATDLDLSENLIKSIPVNTFSHLLNLTQVTLNWANKNSAVDVAPNAFKNLTNLKVLKLSGIGLENVPDNLPPSLKVLILEKNRILSLDRKSFTGIKNVTHLFLGKNCYFWNPCGQITSVAEDSFEVLTSLKTLDLSFNNLTEVPKGLPKSLTVLKLSTNHIEYLSDTDFLGLHNLKELLIQGNCPRCNNAPYPCTPCNNTSLIIHPNAFNDLTQLKTLNLGGNSLKYLNASLFKNLKNLKQLFMRFNFLIPSITQQKDSFLKYITKLERFDVSFNFALKEYPLTINLSKEFSNLRELKTLHMEGLVFQTIDQDTLSPLYKLKKLSTLNIGTNFIIHCDSRIFKNLSHLKFTYLAENRLFPTPVQSPARPRLGSNQKLDLYIPPLLRPHERDIEYMLAHRLVQQECFNAGRVLVLSSNNLFFISPKQFEGYGNIACLNLSGNGFSAALNGTEFTTLPNLTYLDLSFNKIDLAFNSAFVELNKLEVLDISHNYHYFQAFGVTHNLNFTINLPFLRVLNMSYNFISTLTTKQMHSKSLAELRFSHNYLGTLWKENDGSYRWLFKNLTNLTILDISSNRIIKIPDNVYECLPCNLTRLHISHNLLTDFKWGYLKLFRHLQTLDLSYNNLLNVTGLILDVNHSLSILDLSNNKILHLASGFLKAVKVLQVLNLRDNKLTSINESTFQLRPEYQNLTLRLENNPFQCTCDALDFILWIENSGVKIPRLTNMVTCDSPPNEKGRMLIYFDITQCVNANLAFTFYIITSSFTIAFMFLTTFAHLFYWDASYVLHYVKARLKGYHSLTSTDSFYDVFVTYDTKDPHVSEWVMKNLRVKLEEEGEYLPLCLEERDWLPGVPLVDNLTQSIRYSRKTLFVLTEGYVKTGAFKLAMYLAHQRLLDENVDVIVVLMLEPVLQHSHFLRLRRRLCGESVMEWPRTAAAEPWFWQNLRNVVRVDNQTMYNKNYSKYFTSK